MYKGFFFSIILIEIIVDTLAHTIVKDKIIQEITSAAQLNRRWGLIFPTRLS